MADPCADPCVDPRPLDPDEGIALARQQRQHAHALGRYLLSHWNQLSQEERSSLADREHALLAQAQALLAQAADLVLDETRVSLASLQEASGRAQVYLERVQDIRRALAAATVLLDLGAALLTRDTAALMAALQEANQAFQS